MSRITGVIKTYERKPNSILDLALDLMNLCVVNIKTSFPPNELQNNKTYLDNLIENIKKLKISSMEYEFEDPQPEVGAQQVNAFNSHQSNISKENNNSLIRNHGPRKLMKGSFNVGSSPSFEPARHNLNSNF